MWFFNSPEIVYGEGALSYLEQLTGRRAFIVTDPTLAALGYPEQVREHLRRGGITSTVYTDVEPEPSLETIRRGAEAMAAYGPDWIVGLGGGSCLDAAKAMWVLYERPDVPPDAISPLEPLGLRRKARLICIPTTAGTGSEATWAIVLTDPHEHRKLGLGSREALPDIAIVDPALTRDLPPDLTAATGMDALTHAVEGFTSSWANPFSDALCLHAARLILTYLPRAVRQGSRDPQAREMMAIAATMAGLGFGNSMAALAHALGHSTGALFGVHHGRIVGLFLPYTVEFTGPYGDGRYQELARYLDLPATDDVTAAQALATAVRQLAAQIHMPLSLQEIGITREALAQSLDRLCDLAETDPTIVTSRRVPSRDELRRLFLYAYEGRSVDF